jgi:hypothetical protein
MEHERATFVLRHPLSKSRGEAEGSPPSTPPPRLLSGYAYAKVREMIDVWEVIANSLWILGLVVLLAVLSWAHWVASTEKNRLRVVLQRPSIQIALDVGLVLFCAGLAATGRTWWERTLWGLLAAAWMFQTWSTGRKKRYADKNNNDR